MSKWVIHFQDGHKQMKALLGGKGANLAEMTRAGLPIPPGFTVTTEACRAYYAANSTLPIGLLKEIKVAMRQLELNKGQYFGDHNDPLLVSVRSGSVASMPGMMDTILNLGLNDETVIGLANMTHNERFAYDCYRRLIQMFGNVVFGVHSIHFDKQLQDLKKEEGWDLDREVSAEGWKELIVRYKEVIDRFAERSFPQDVYEQMELAVEAVFRSWNNQRAIVYRKVHKIPDEQGTAVNIQSMVFGNMDDDCGTGVLFTRDPSTGEKSLFGEYLVNAQGEDVVAGVRTPQPIVELARDMPVVYDQLVHLAEQLELHYKDMQDIEFTVERNRLYILQTRNGKRTAQAAVQIAVDLVREGIISKHEALRGIDVMHLERLLHPAIRDDATLDVLTLGLPASPGAASGQAVFDAGLAEQWRKEGRRVILVSKETTPEDIGGVFAAEGVLTTRGGMTSHAAVVARGMGKPCVCGCESILIDEIAREFTAGHVVIREGDWMTIDGATGRVIRGSVPLTTGVLSDELRILLTWADEVRRLHIRTNADHPEDASKAREFGAEGIGLCRTEHMFMSAGRVPVMQELILAEDDGERAVALSKLLPMQQSDFTGLFRAMDGLPVTIRLLDPPLHEFLPHIEELQQRHWRIEAGLDESEDRDTVEKLLRKVRALHESNPMFGQRGCRLGIVFPEIYEMQVEALFRAALICMKEGVRVQPEIMIPLVGHMNELRMMRELVDRMAKKVFDEMGQICHYKVGTMIEVPRAALTADQIAQEADFFSFGTNDLTQMTFGYSRDDAEGKFLTQYIERSVLPANPFQILDHEGVGMLIDWATKKGKEFRADLKTGICGEHGGDKESIFFCHKIGLDYVSCSPFRVPLARIAAAQAMLELN